MFQWTMQVKGKPRRNQAAVVLGHELYSFGGDRKLMEVHVFNTVTLCWRMLSPETPGGGQPHLELPSRREGYTAVLIEDTVYLWGGYAFKNNTWEFYNHLYAFNVSVHRWFSPRVSGTVPQGRDSHSACNVRRVMYIHGGWIESLDALVIPTCLTPLGWSGP